MSKALLQVKGLKKYYPFDRGLLGTYRQQVHAVEDVSFHVDRGETLSIVGESGCGKSTVGKAVLRLIEPTAGSIRFDGEEIAGLSPREMRSVRRRLQIVFQDPFSSMNPRMKVRDIIAEPISSFGIATGKAEITDRVRDLVARVGLPSDSLDRFPHEFSGGQRQRICIARALGSGADLIVCDEAVSALDVSVKAQIVNLLVDLQAEFGLAFLFISHDLAIVEHLTHRVAVMYLGHIVEMADRQSLFTGSVHPYTRALLSAVPVPRVDLVSQRIVLKGDVPSPINPPAGCRFHTRCPHVFDRCRVEEPKLTSRGADHLVACHL